MIQILVTFRYQKTREWILPDIQLLFTWKYFELHSIEYYFFFLKKKDGQFTIDENLGPVTANPNWAQ